MSLRSLTDGLLALALCLASCGGSGGGGGGSETVAASLAGSVRDANGVGLEGVGVEVSGPTALVTATTFTDVDGNFIVFGPPLGPAVVSFDGSSSSSPGTFAALALPVTIGSGANDVAQAIVLPDLDQGATKIVVVGANGATTVTTTIVADAQTVLSIPAGTTLRLDGVLVVGSLEVNVTPVQPENVPFPLPDGLDPSAFVTIQPPNAGFDHGIFGQGQPQGASLELPNTRNLSEGTQVDIWCFDPGAGEPGRGAWVNRSVETGNRGVVTDVAGNLAIVAPGVVLTGGWHAAALAVEPSCATTLAGRVLDPQANPIPGVLVALTTGQSGVSGADGRFSIASVPAYDAGSLPSCAPLDFGVRFLAPVSYGSVARADVVLAGDVAPGATTDLGDVELAVLDTGSLVGRVSDAGVPQDGNVSLIGPAPATDVLQIATSGGTFFAASLAPGAYTASFAFESGTSSTGLAVVAHATTVLSLEPERASSDAVNVLVFDMGAGNAVARPLAGARVTLQNSGQGIESITNLSGIASFDGLSGPFTVTAQVERDAGAFTQRLATSLVGVVPVDGTIALPFFGLPSANDVVVDATVRGTLANVPAGALVLVDVASNQVPGGYGAFAFADDGGAYSIAVPSGVLFDVSVQSLDGPLGAMFATGLSVAPGGELERNFDFESAGFVPFDVVVPVTYTHAPSGPDVTASANLVVRGSGDLAFLALAEDSAGAPPATVFLPNLARPQFSGVFRALQVTALVTDPQTQDADVVTCTLPLPGSTPAALAMPFVGAASNVQPADQDTFQCSREDCLDLAGEIFSLSLGASVPGLAQGYNVFDIDRGPQDASSDWKILIAPGATSAGLPRIAPEQPMFTDGEYDLGLEIVRFTAQAPFDFATFFDASAPTKLRDVNRTSTVCSTESDSRFGVTTPPGPGLAFRAGRGPSRAEALRAAVAAERARRATGTRSPAAPR